MTTSMRDEVKLLIARQLAQANGIRPDLILVAGKPRDHYMTLAESILATVERKASVKWTANIDFRDGKFVVTK